MKLNIFKKKAKAAEEQQELTEEQETEAEALVGRELDEASAAEEIAETAEEELAAVQKAEDRKAEAERLGVQALLRDRLIWAHDHYMQKGCYPIYARENVEEMYTRYHALGGNGTVTSLVRELDGLPTEPR